jgi:hypothetical protein
MLKALSNDLLSFEPNGFHFNNAKYDDEGFPLNLTPSQKEKFHEWEEETRRIIDDKFDKIFCERASEPDSQTPPTVYDEVFFEGMRTMNESGMINIPPGIYTIEIRPISIDPKDTDV